MYVIGQNSIQVRIFQCCLIPNFLCLVTLIHEWLGQADSKLKGTEIENQPKNHKMLLEPQTNNMYIYVTGQI